MDLNSLKAANNELFGKQINTLMKTPSVLLTACFFFLFPGLLSAAEFSSTKGEGIGAVFDSWLGNIFDEEPSRYAKRSRLADDKDFDVDEKSPVSPVEMTAASLGIQDRSVSGKPEDCAQAPEYLFSVGDSAENIAVRGTLEPCSPDDEGCIEKKGPLYSFSMDGKKTTVMGVMEPCVNFDKVTQLEKETQRSPYFVADASSHKGATFPLTDTYLPDCSEFIDPKDAAKFSHCAGPVQPSNDKWHGFLELMGKPGTVRSLGQADLFFPIAQDENDLTFFDLRGQLDDFDNSEYNIGIGHRHMFDENSDSLLRGWIIGGYGFFDHRFNESGNRFMQATFGLELKSEVWDFRGNGYIPESTTKRVTSGANATIIRPGDQIRAQIGGVFDEKALAGYDGEVGYKLPLADLLLPDKDWFADTRLYLGGYHFIGEGNFETVAGPRLRLETRIHDVPVLGNGSRLLLGLETQYDDPRGSQTFGLVSLRIPFGVGSNFKARSLKGLDRRMMDPVVRDVDVVASQNDVPVEEVPVLNENGEEITRVVDVEMADCAGEADPDACMQTAVSNMMSSMNTNEEVGLVFVHGMGDGVTVMDWDDMAVMSDQIVASAGNEIRFNVRGSSVSFEDVGYTEDGTPVGTNGEGCWILQDGAQLSGWTVDGSGMTNASCGNTGQGVRITSAGNYHITNSTFENFDRNDGSAYALYVDHADAVVNVEGSLFQNIRFENVVLNDGELNISNTRFIGNAFADGYSKLAIDQNSGLLRVEDTTIEGQFGWAGISLDGGTSEIRRVNITFDEITLGGFASTQDPEDGFGNLVPQHGIEVHNSSPANSKDVFSTIEDVVVDNFGSYGFFVANQHTNDSDTTTVSRIVMRNVTIQNGRNTPEQAADLFNGGTEGAQNAPARGWAFQVGGTARVDVYDSRIINNQGGGVKVGNIGNQGFEPVAYFENVIVSGNDGIGMTVNNEGVFEAAESKEVFFRDYLFGNGDRYGKVELNEGGNDSVITLGGELCESDDNNLFDSISCRND